MKIDLKKLGKFLVKAKKETYASLKSKEVAPERAGHKELEFQKGEFYYRDSYTGFFQAPGMEEVRLGGKMEKPSGQWLILVECYQNFIKI